MDSPRKISPKDAAWCGVFLGLVWMKTHKIKVSVDAG